MQARSMRMRSLRKPLQVVAREIEKLTDDAFDRSMSPAGETFPSLAESTIEARARQSKAARKRDEFGDLTPKAERIRAGIRAPGGVKPMVNTGRARNSQHATVIGDDAIQWSAVGYLEPSITGGKHIPKRNVSVFEKSGDGYVLIPALQQKLRGAIVTHVRGEGPL